MSKFVLILTVLMLASPSYAEPRPEDVLGKLAKYHQFALSPTGHKLLVLQAAGESYHLGLIDLESQKLSLLMASDPLDFRFDRCHWANEQRIVCVLAVQTKRIIQGRQYKSEETRLVAVNADGSDMRQFKPPRFKRMIDVPKQEVRDFCF